MSSVICLHAWRFEDGGQTYADPEAGEHVDGWSVYVRRESSHVNEPFEVDIDEDFDSYDAARPFADALGRRYCSPVQEY